MNPTPIEIFPQRKHGKNERPIFPDNRHTLVFIVESEQDRRERAWKQHRETSTADMPYYSMEYVALCATMQTNIQVSWPLIDI